MPANILFENPLEHMTGTRLEIYAEAWEWFG